jgi:hypothetical protein
MHTFSSQTVNFICDKKKDKKIAILQKDGLKKGIEIKLGPNVRSRSHLIVIISEGQSDREFVLHPHALLHLIKITVLFGKL